MIAFLAGAVALTLAAVALVVVPLMAGREGRAPLAAVAAALAIPAAVILLYAAVSSYPWPQAGSGGAAAADSPAIAALRARSQADPADASAAAALGDGLLAEERYAEARDAFAGALRAAGAEAGDDLRLAYAEAAILVDRNALGGEAGQIIEDVLARDPVNPKALWYGGMAALGRGDADAARTRWSRLLDLSPPPQVRQIIEQQLARLSGDADGRATAGAGSGPARIPLRITVAPALASRIQPGAALFLFARTGEAAGGPPLAVARREASQLPLETALSDADSMVPGRSLSGAAEVRVTARVANDGEALPAPGDVYGEAVWRAGEGGATLEINMDRVVE